MVLTTSASPANTLDATSYGCDSHLLVVSTAPAHAHDDSCPSR
jgi:hypothetical protein